MYTLTVKSHFDSAHFLKGYKGPCANTHGHSFLYEVNISGEDLDSLGMLWDFKEVKKRLKENIENLLDHKFLNELEAFSDKNPTAENLACLIYNILRHKTGWPITSVTVWESEDCGITYTKQ